MSGPISNSDGRSKYLKRLMVGCMASKRLDGALYEFHTGKLEIYNAVYS